MALQQNIYSMTYLAGAAITQWTFVDLSTAADGTVVTAAAGGPAIGIATSGAASGAGVPVQELGRCKVTVGAVAITRGALLASDANGNAVVAVSTNYAVARAVESAASGALVTVELIQYGKQ
ncbi:MAG: hypothetical protein JWO59_727 [Chloroflexi bacterium]|nr:hypothetical protein [Chloroflexota bacterium]